MILPSSRSLVKLERKRQHAKTSIEKWRKADDSNITPAGAHRLAGEPCNPYTLAFHEPEKSKPKIWRADDSNTSARRHRIAFQATSPPRRFTLQSPDLTKKADKNIGGRRVTRTPVTCATDLFSKQAARPGAFTFQPYQDKRSRQDLNLRLRPSQSRVLSAELREQRIDTRSQESGRIERHSAARAYRFQNGLPDHWNSLSVSHKIEMTGLTRIEPASSLRQNEMLTTTPQPQFFYIAQH